MRIFSLAIFLAFISSDECPTIKLSVRKTVMDEGENVAFNTETLINDTDKMMTVVLFFNNQRIAHQIVNSDYYVTVYGISKFQNRINSFIDGSNYVVTINLRINDHGIYQVGMLVEIDTKKQIQFLSEKISIVVRAHPVVLKFPNVVLGIKGSKLTFDATVYCQPKPESVLKLGNETMNPMSSTNLPENKFSYVYTLGPFTPETDCGKMFLFTVNGVVKQVQQAAPLIFVPPKVEVILVKQYNDLSVFIQWKKIAFGKCELTYNIEFLNSTYDTIKKSYIVSNTEVSITKPDSAILVKVYAAMNDMAGESTFFSIPPALGAPPLKTTTILGIVFGVVAAIIAVGIIILVVVKKILPPSIAYSKLSSSGQVLNEQMENSLLSPDKIKNPSLSNNLIFPLSPNKMENFSLSQKTEVISLPHKREITSSPNKTEVHFSPLKPEILTSPKKKEILSLPNKTGILSSPQKTEILPSLLNQVPALPKKNIPLLPNKTEFPSPSNQVTSPSNQVTSPSNQVTSPSNQVTSPISSPTAAHNKLYSSDIIHKKKMEISLPPDKTKNLPSNDLGFPLSPKKVEGISLPKKTEILSLPLNQVLPEIKNQTLPIKLKSPLPSVYPPTVPKKDIPLLIKKTEIPSPSKKI